LDVDALAFAFALAFALACNCALRWAALRFASSCCFFGDAVADWSFSTRFTFLFGDVPSLKRRSCTAPPDRAASLALALDRALALASNCALRWAALRFASSCCFFGEAFAADWCLSRAVDGDDVPSL